MKKLVILASTKCGYDEQLLLAKDHLVGETVLIQIGDLSLDVLQKGGFSVVISSGLSKEWFYILRGLGISSITFGDREYYSQLSDIVIDYKNESGEHYFTGASADFTREPDIAICEVADLIRKLDWDTDFFGYNVAFLSCLHLTENIYKNISLFVEENKIRLIEYLCNCHDSRSVEIAEKSGFSFVDIRITFIKHLVSSQPYQLPGGIEFRKSTEQDILALEKIANGIYTKSRYFFDKRFEEKKVIEFYLSWVRKAVRGEFDDECWCLTENNEPFAFCTVRYVKNGTAQIGLLGMSNLYQGRGLGKALLKSVFEVLLKKNISWVTVATQGRNYPAQNLYQSVGFITKETQLWYHKWL